MGFGSGVGQDLGPALQDQNLEGGDMQMSRQTGFWEGEGCPDRERERERK